MVSLFSVRCNRFWAAMVYLKAVNRMTVRDGRSGQSYRGMPVHRQLRVAGRATGASESVLHDRWWGILPIRSGKVVDLDSFWNILKAGIMKQSFLLVLFFEPLAAPRAGDERGL